MITHKVCPVCDSTDHSEVFEAKDYLLTGELFKISHCNNCTARFTNPAPDPQEVVKYYAADAYVSHSNTDQGLFFKVYQAVRNKTIKSKIKLIKGKTKLKQGRLLDIGCATGHFLNGITQAGWNTLGLEPDTDARNMAIQNFELNVQPSEKLFELEEGSFDAITMWHVMEHVHDLHEYMAQIKKLLKPSGVFFMALPNYNCLDGDHYGKYWDGYDVPRHLYHFSAKSIKMLADKSGMHVDELRPMPYDPFYSAILSEKAKRHSGTQMQKKNSGNIIAAAFWGGLSWLNMWMIPSRATAITYIIRK